MSFEGQIQQWVSLDNQLKILTDKVKDLRDRRNNLEENITKYAINHNMSNTTIPISDGKLKITKTRVPEPLTFKYLEKTLSEIIKNESQLKIIMDHVKQKRNIKVVEEIKRLYNN
jgi:hypothetical protein